MNIRPVAYRYAKSLLDLALEKGQLPAVQEDMALVADTCAASEDLRVLLKSPVVRADKKDKVLDAVFAGKIGTLTLTFMTVLVRKGREGMLHEVAMAFREIYRKHERIVVCTVTTAVPMTNEEKEHVRRIAAARFPGDSVKIDEKLDPSLIGGGIIQVGDLQWDASVKSKLHAIRRTLAENPYQAKI